MAVRDRSQQALAPRRPPIAPGHVGRCPGFIKEDQTFRVQRRLLGAPGDPALGYVGAFLLGRKRTLFLKNRGTHETIAHAVRVVLDAEPAMTITEVVVAPDIGSVVESPGGAAIEVRLADGARIRIPVSASPDLAAAVIRAAAGR